jgi:hypothetical protein
MAQAQPRKNQDKPTSITGKVPGQFRIGKTKSDMENHAHSTNRANKETRASWQNDSKATANNFPYGCCNGKRNRALKERKAK